MISSIFTVVTASLIGIFAQMPSSTNLKLRDYTIGTGGGANSASGTYQAEGVTGEASGQQSVGGTYTTKSGLQQTQQANVPSTPTLVNSSNWYDKLHFVIDNGNNPTDAKFAIAISTDDFATTNYIQSDNTIGATLGSEDYQTYTLWGSASGEDVVGLTPSTTYKIKVKAMHGNFTESGYSPTATAATVSAQLSFDIDVSDIDEETGSPYGVDFGSVPAGSVTNAPDKIWFDFATNANSGGNIYVYSLNGGLNSAFASYTISSATVDLSSASEGFGAVSQGATQSSGGPIAAVSPYNGSGNNVGILNSSVREIYSSSAALNGGRTNFLLKARSQTLTPQADDYTEVITAIAAGNF